MGHSRFEKEMKPQHWSPRPMPGLETVSSGNGFTEVITEVIIVGEKRAQSRKTLGAPMLRSTAEKYQLKRPTSSFFFLSLSVFIYYLAALGLSCPHEIVIVAWASLVVVLGLSGFLVACSRFPARDRTHVPVIRRWILDHWTTREVPKKSDFLKWLISISWCVTFITWKAGFLGICMSLICLATLSSGNENESLKIRKNTSFSSVSKWLTVHSNCVTWGGSTFNT